MIQSYCYLSWTDSEPALQSGVFKKLETKDRGCWDLSHPHDSYHAMFEFFSANLHFLEAPLWSSPLHWLQDRGELCKVWVFWCLCVCVCWDGWEIVMLELWAEEVKDGGGSGVAAVLYASFHGWQKMESPPMGASFCSEKPGEGYFGGWKIKRERVKKSEWGGGWGRGCPAIAWDRSNHSWLISFIPCLPPFPSTSLSQTASLHFSVLSQK